MVGFAFIFLAVILLSPILLVLLIADFIMIRLRPPLHLRRGFEVIQPVEKQ